MKTSWIHTVFTYSAISCALIIGSMAAVQAEKRPEKARPQSKERGDAEPAPAPGQRGERAERSEDRREPAPRELEDVTFLGIAAHELDPVVRQQLDIPPGTGIAVREILPDSPAARAGIEQHNVLTRLDDQILVSPEQLQVLIRMKSAGDTINITCLRATQERNIAVTLETRSVPKPNPALVRPDLQDPSGHPWLRTHPLGERQPGEDRSWEHHYGEMLDKLREQWGDQMGKWRDQQRQWEEQFRDRLDELEDQGAWPPERWLDRLGEDGFRSFMAEIFDQQATIQDDDGTVVITMKEGKKFVTASDADGNEIFEGFCETEEERSKVPTEILEKVDSVKMELSVPEDFDFHRSWKDWWKSGTPDRDEDRRQRNGPPPERRPKRNGGSDAPIGGTA